MLDIFPLAIFPETSLASSVITTVWVGVMVVAFFNLRLGWVLSGLVVPGYLVPLLITKPWAAAVVLGEGVLTYWIVWFFSEYLSRFGGWGGLFGRDRFFALFLVSVAVRIVMDGWLLPIAGGSINDWLSIHFDYRNNLHSFGLIIVALVANQFWKTGFIRGIIPLVVTLGLTYLIVRYGLMELTNFSISGINYLYEDVASSMLSSPKAYIILIVTALIASRMNLHYGWDFNGILIPALLALQWYQPSKILISFAEAFLIYGLAILILRTPMFQQISMEGGRKLLLFFNIGFAYKILLGYLLLWYLPDYKATDFFAFGYLLSTLIAIKMHDKDIAARLTRATLQTSLVSVILASMVGFALTLTPAFWFWPTPQANSIVTPLLLNHNDHLIDLVRQDKVAMYQSKSKPVDLPLPQEMDHFAQGIRQLLRFDETRDPADLAEARQSLAQVNYAVSEIEHGLLYLREYEPHHGWGVYVIRLGAPNKLVIEAPAPMDELGVASVGVAIFGLTQARALAIGGSLRGANPDGSADVLRNYQTIFNVFHRTLARQDLLQIRAYKKRRVALLQEHDDKKPGNEPISGLWVKSELPEAVNLKQLKTLIGELPITWGDSSMESIQRQMSRGRYAELLLAASEIRRIQARLVLAEQGPKLQQHNQEISGYLKAWILETKADFAPSGSDRYVIPKEEELLFFDEEVLTPLLRLIDARRKLDAWSDAQKGELRLLHATAAVMGYGLTLYRHQTTGEEFLILAEKNDTKQRRYWGSYLFRIAQGEGFMVQIPRPLFEINSFEAGVALFKSLNAELLLIANASPNANSDRSSDVLNMQQTGSLFNLVNQVSLREAKIRNIMVVQSRAFGLHPGEHNPSSSVLLAFDNGAYTASMLSAKGRRLSEAVDAIGLNYSFVDGSAATTGYEVHNLPQSKYLEQSQNKEFAAVWFSPLARLGFRQQSENTMQQAQFNAIGLPSREGDVQQLLLDEHGNVPLHTIPQGLRQALSNYLETHDVVSLYRAHKQYPSYRLELLVDVNSQHVFLFIYQQAGHRIALVMNPSAQDAAKSELLSADQKPAVIHRYIESGAAWLEMGD